MGLFGKKKEEKKEYISELPELPKLPELPGLGMPQKTLNQLPSLPMSSFGEKFSQDTIKEAVSGDKKGDEFSEEDFDADDFEADSYEDEAEMMPLPLTKIRSREMPVGFKDSRMTKSAEPVFVRLDKFEESLELFEKTKRQISEIEKMLSGIKKIKEHEEEDLNAWEEELQSIKVQIGKVDSDIFSKI